MKKATALFLTAAMAAGMLAGCGSNAGTGKSASGNASGGGQASNTPAQTSEANGQDAAAQPSRTDEAPYEVVIENLTLGQEMADVPEIEQKINEITLPAINVTVKLLNLHIGDHASKVSLAAAGGDKMDIVTTGRTYKLTQMVSDGVIIPLEDLIDQYAPNLKAKVGNVIEANRIGGHIYAIPGQYMFYNKSGIIYNKDMADEYGISVPETVTFDDMEKIAVQLKEKKPEVYLLSKGNGDNDAMWGIYDEGWIQFDNLMYGVIAKDDENSTIVNPFETDSFRQYIHEMVKWNKNAWMPQDQMTNGVNVRDYLITGQAFCEWGTTGDIQMGTMQPQYDFTIAMSDNRDAEITTTGVQEHGWGIHINCERPDKAMQLLEMMYNNEELVNLLSNGIEGKDYVHVTERTITYPDGVDASNVGYTRIFSDFGDPMQIYKWLPVTEENIDTMEADSAKAEKNRYFGYSFDPASLSSQISNCSTVISEYLPSLACGIYDEAKADEQLDKLIDQLKRAGMEEIIAENQRQLNEWIAANK